MFCPIPVLCWHGRSWTFYTDSLQLLVSPVFISNLLFNLTSVSLVLLSCCMSVFFNNLYVIFRSGWTLVCHHTVSDGRYVSSLVMSCRVENHTYTYIKHKQVYMRNTGFLWEKRNSVVIVLQRLIESVLFWFYISDAPSWFYNFGLYVT